MSEPRTIPFDYLDKACLSGTSREHGTSGAPVWEFVVEGQLDPDTLKDALGRTLKRYPTARSRVGFDGDYAKAKKFWYVVDDAFDVNDVFEVVDLSEGDDAAYQALRQSAWDRYLDPFETYPLYVTFVRRGPDKAHVLVQQHHGIADGRAFIGLLSDLNHYLAHPDETPSDEAPRVAEDAILGLSRGKRIWWSIVGAFTSLGMILFGLFRPIKPLAHNLTTDFTGHNRAEFFTVPASVLATWKPAGKAAGLSVNSVLSAAMLLAVGRWSRAQGTPPGRTNYIIPAETRPRDAPDASFANHLASFYVATSLDPAPDALELARHIQQSVRRQAKRKTHLKKLLAERAVVLDMRMGKMRQLVFGSKRTAINLALSNLIPLEFPQLRGEGWVARHVRICTPGIPRGGMGPTVVRYGDEICFNFNYTTTAVPEGSMPALVSAFSEELDAAWQALGCPPLPGVA